MSTFFIATAGSAAVSWMSEEEEEEEEEEEGTRVVGGFYVGIPRLKADSTCWWELVVGSGRPDGIGADAGVGCGNHSGTDLELG